jgi:threonine dehydrogenase-like Zn-dependent dehydrogenase
MKALTVVPGQPDSAKLEELKDPPAAAGSVLVETVTIGVCGTDVELVKGLYGAPPPGQSKLVLGHESLGRVLEAPAGSGLEAGDAVVGIVRMPDPVPCPSCAVGEWDMCRNGQYTEHGIKELNGFGSERFRIPAEFAVKIDSRIQPVGVLLEPTSVVAKAWEQIERIGSRAHWYPQRVLVTGAGPIGLLAALLGVQRGLDVHVLDIVTDGPKPLLVAALGATYHSGSVEEACQNADIVLECTGVASLVFQVMRYIGPQGIVCLTGLSSGGRKLAIDLGELNHELVLENNVIVGSVNANRRHYQAAAEALRGADMQWLKSLITRRVPLAHWAQALERQPHDVKTVIDFQASLA